MIFAAGTGNPHFTTDTAAALRASEVNAGRNSEVHHGRHALRFRSAQEPRRQAHNRHLLRRGHTAPAPRNGHNRLYALPRAQDTPGAHILAQRSPESGQGRERGEHRNNHTHVIVCDAILPFGRAKRPEKSRRAKLRADNEALEALSLKAHQKQ